LGVKFSRSPLTKAIAINTVPVLCYHVPVITVVLAGLLARAEGLAILTVARIGFLVTARAGSGIVIAKLGNRS